MIYYDDYINSKADKVLELLDEAIEEYEKCEFISEEELFKDLKNIKE